jgi:hypothetical protein
MAVWLAVVSGCYHHCAYVTDSFFALRRCHKRASEIIQRWWHSGGVLSGVSQLFAAHMVIVDL